MRNISEKENAQRRDRKMWIQVKLNHEETCKNLIETLIKKKKLFHNTREFIFFNYQLFLKASPSSDTRSWRESISTFEEKAKILEAEITECELKLNEQLCISDLALKNIITQENHHRKESPATLAARNDLRTLKQDVTALRANKEITFPYARFEYPSIEKSKETDCTEENVRILNTIQEKIAEEKNRDIDINSKIENQYKKIVDSSHKVVEHHKYTYTQSVYTGIVNVIGLLTGIGLVNGLFNKATGGHFFMWEKTPTVDLQPKEWNVFRESAAILGVSKKR